MSNQRPLHSAARLLALASLAAMVAGRTAAAQGPADASRGSIPSSIRAEHHEIHEALERATKLGGRTGVAARALAAVLGPHFAREEQIALPPLSMLAPLARDPRAAVPAWLLPMTDSLRRELPRMLREHVAIQAATRRLGEVARSEGQPLVAQFTDKLLLHAGSEEEVLYPAAILVGDLVRARSSRR